MMPSSSWGCRASKSALQDRLNAKLDKYMGISTSFRDAVFVVDPEKRQHHHGCRQCGEMSFTLRLPVQQDLDAVAGQISSKADNVTADSQGSRITEAEQRINGLDASLSQTVTRGVHRRTAAVTQIGQELNATKGIDPEGHPARRWTSRAKGWPTQRKQADGAYRRAEFPERSALMGWRPRLPGRQRLFRPVSQSWRGVTAESDQVTAQRVSGLEDEGRDVRAKIQAR